MLCYIADAIQQILQDELQFSLKNHHDTRTKPKASPLSVFICFCDQRRTSPDKRWRGKHQSLDLLRVRWQEEPVPEQTSFSLLQATQPDLILVLCKFLHSSKLVLSVDRRNIHFGKFCYDHLPHQPNTDLSTFSSLLICLHPGCGRVDGTGVRADPRQRGRFAFSRLV